MTSCPIENCKELAGLTDSINKDIENRRSWIKYWLSGIGTFMIVISAASIITWARANDIPELKQDGKNREARLVIAETNQKIVMAQIDKMVANQQTIIEALAELKADVKNIKRERRETQ